MNPREPDHLNLLCDLGELTTIVTGNSDIETFFNSTTDLIATHLKAHVCSIYLFETQLDCLVLKATQGLNPEAVDQVKMKSGEGLVGLCYLRDSIIREGNASQNPGFKYFDNADESDFNSFLCVPIRSGIETIGVLVVQHREVDHFTRFDERALKTAVTQLASAIENARLLMTLAPAKNKQVLQPQGFPPFIKGQSDTIGSVFGQIHISNQNRKSLIHNPIQPETCHTIEDFESALDKTIQQLRELQEKFAKRLPESASLIFTAHFMILKDKNFTGKMKTLIEGGLSPVTAVQQTAQKYIALFSSSPHAYLQEKAVDVEDLSIRILSNLLDAQADTAGEKGTIVVAEDLYPSDILKLTADGIQGIVLVGGGVASHVTILSRSLGIPLIIADNPLLLSLPGTTYLLMDAGQGNVYINPDPETLDLFTGKQAIEEQARTRTMSARTFTQDNEQIKLLANINLLSEIRLAKELKAEGVGLYRTEFPFLIRSGFPSEDEQYLIYKQLVDENQGRVTTIRTLDAGGEKSLEYAGFAREANPVLGLRSIRFTLKYREVFDTQIRAILRAAHGKKDVRLMFPLISSVDEFLEAKQVVQICARELKEEGIPHEKKIDMGMMIELPSVMATIDEFASLADFFAIGTNDFVQYMMGADRANKLVADYYIPYHPAVNRAMETIARAAAAHGIDVSVCGEMAHDPAYIPFLIGVGIRTLSVDPQFLPAVQETITGLSMKDARAYAIEMLAQTRVKDAAILLNRTW